MSRQLLVPDPLQNQLTTVKNRLVNTWVRNLTIWMRITNEIASLKYLLLSHYPVLPPLGEYNHNLVLH